MRRLRDTECSAWCLVIHAVVVLGWGGIGVLTFSLSRMDYTEMEAEAAPGAGLVVVSVVWSLVSLAGGLTLLVLCWEARMTGPGIAPIPCAAIGTGNSVTG